METGKNTLEEKRENKRWLYVSVLIHCLLLLFLFIFPLFSYTYPPLVPQEGILVSFGQKDIGQFNDVPDTQNEEKTETQKKVQAVKPTTSSSQSNNKKIVTQDLTTAASLPDEDDKNKKTSTPNKLDLEEAERQKEIAKAKQQEIDEQKRLKEAEEAREKAYEQSKKQYSDLFKGKGKGSTTEDGNQGIEDGHKNATALSGLTTGSGTIGGGLGNRGVISAPKIKENSQKKGKVVLKICVDPSGSVTSAQFTQRGSTTTDADLVRLSKESARKWQFNASTITKQCGTITFDFKIK